MKDLEPALAVFLQALGVSIYNFFDQASEGAKRREHFLRVLDGYIGVMLDEVVESEVKS